MENVKVSGGARIGFMKATWPFITLEADSSKLQLKTSFFGNFIFKKEDIISIEPYSVFLSTGVKINHRVSHYNKDIIFLTMGDSHDLIERIRRTGFFSGIKPILPETENNIEYGNNQVGFPLKRSVAIGAIVIWNLLFLYDFGTFFLMGMSGFPLGIGSRFALAGVIFFCGSLLISESFRSLVLKEGRSIEGMKKAVVFIMMVCGLILTTSIFLMV